MKTVVALALCASFALSACTTTTKVTPVQPGDANLTCAQLRSEFQNLDRVDAEANRDQGVNGANVAAFIFFPLAIVGNYLSADEAKDLSRSRRTHLMTIYNDKRCDG